MFGRKTKSVDPDRLSFELFGKIRIGVPETFSRKTRILEALRKGRYEAEEAQALQRNLEPDDRLLDLGSGIGAIASLAAQAIPSAHITCVEANPDLLPVIQANLERNGASEATLLHGAVCSAPDGSDIEFHVGPNFTAASLSAEGRGQFTTIRVPTLKFSELLERSKPTFITCDVEGAELDLLETTLPASVRFFCLEVHLSWLGEHGIQELFNRMHAHGFAYHPRGSSGSIVCFKRMPV